MATCNDRTWRSWLISVFSVVGVFAPAIFSTVNYANAQIIPDETLSNSPSTITPNVNIQGLPADRIDGGVSRGANLFHSFREFNVGDNQRVYFGNPTGIENILTRITGNKVSNILGTLGIDGAANLFLLNPNGILFGKNARLDVAGSFIASTANSFVFGDGIEFSATNPQAPPLLKINLTPGLQYGTNDPSRSIENQGNLTTGQDLKLFAGKLNLQGQLQSGRDLILQADTIKVRDTVTHPFIAAAGGKLLVQGNESVDIFTLNHPGSGLFSRGEMVLRSANTVGGDTHFWSGGNFRIEKLDSSLGNLFSPYDPIIRSLGDVSFFGYQGASLHIFAGGNVNIGTAIITDTDTVADTINPKTTPELANVTLSDGTSVVIDGSTRHTLDVRAGMKPEAIGIPLEISGLNFPDEVFFIPNPSGANFVLAPPPANNPVATSADITIGDVFASSGIVLLTNQYQPNPSLTSGDITINGTGIFGDGIDVRGFGGDGGNVIVDARSNITLNSLIDADAVSVFEANGGNITLLADGDITLNSGASLLTAGLLGGSISLKSDGDIFVRGGGAYNLIQSLTYSNVPDTKGADINFKARSLSVTNGAQLSANTLGQANAGNLTINVQEKVIVDGENSDGFPSIAYSRVEDGATGNGGNIEISTGSLFLTNGGSLTATTAGQGNAGSVIINARDTIALDGKKSDGSPSQIVSQVSPQGKGNGGVIDIITRALSVTNGGKISASTLGEGNAGPVIINAKESVMLDWERSTGNSSAVLSRVEPGAIGDGSTITIITNSLSLTNGAYLSVSTLGEGNAGGITVNARESVILDGEGSDGSPSGIGSQVQPRAKGDAGDIDIATSVLSLTNGAQLSVTTFGQGNAGNVTVNASEKVVVDGTRSNRGSSAIISTVFSTILGEAVGNGGGIKITTDSLRLTNGVVNAATSGKGDAGNIIVQDANSIYLAGNSSISTAVNEGAEGKGGNIELNSKLLLIDSNSQVSASTLGKGEAGSITVNANSFTATNGGRLSTTTSKDFDAGNIILNVQDNITLLGAKTGLFANTEAGSTGNGGSIFIDPRTVTIEDGAKIAVDSQGEGDGGSIELAAGFLTLDNGSISAETNSSTGGNITLNLQELLLLRNNSQISTNAGLDKAIGTGDGGNITINSPLIAAVPRENSNISANASKGNGGRVNINSQGIFGIEPRSQPSELLSDITASSEFGVQGFVTINTPDVDPARGLVQLPSNLVDAAQQITTSCTPRGHTASRFIATGRGGLPLSPHEPLRGRAVISGWVDLPSQAGERRADKLSTAYVTKSTQQIVEAQKLILDEKGNALLVAKSFPGSSSLSTISCSE
jgi:filamentous hemagglutinin family protein